MGKAVGAREARQDRSQEIEDLKQRRAEEAQVEQQRQEMQQKPGTFPRQRVSHEASLSNNPWARDAQKKAGVVPVVELFVADKCSECAAMEKYLNEVGVPYRLSMLTSGSEEEQRYLSQIGRGLLPVVRMNNSVVRGYEPEAVRQMILREKPQ